MGKRFCALAAAISLTSISARAANLGPILEDALRESNAPAVGALTIREGVIDGLSVRGVRRAGTSTPVRPGDSWLIGSCAKPITATLIAKLVDRGILSWDEPLTKLLPDLAASMRVEYRAVTLKQLLTHHSGLPRDASDPQFFQNFFSDRRSLPEQRTAYIAHALQDAPVAPPGSEFSYSNTGFVIAAAAAERATALSYETLVRREIFVPLGMRSAGFGDPPLPGPVGHSDGRVGRQADKNPAMIAPAGDIHLSLADWAKFAMDQLAGAHGRGRLLKPATYKLLQTAPPGSDIGISWGVEGEVAGVPGPALTHAGSDGNWYAVIVLVPGSDIGALIASNAGPSMGGDKAANLILRSVLPQLSRDASKAHSEASTRDAQPTSN